jgi:hypothetical protein
MSPEDNEGISFDLVILEMGSQKLLDQAGQEN